MLQVALVGAGTIGHVHAASLLHMGNANLAAVCDIRQETAAELAKEHSARAFADLQTLAEDPLWSAIDVVLVCIPTYLHEQTVTLAAKAGKHVFCEKPIALTADAAMRMIDVCADHGVKLGVGHVVRFFPEYVELKRKISAGAIGEIGTVRTFRGGGYPHAWEDWYGQEERSGGILVDLLIHDLDFIDALISPIVSLYTQRLAASVREHRDYALVIGRLQNGALLHMEATWAHVAGFRYGFEYAGSAGMLQFDSSKAPPITLFTRGQQGHQGVTVPESPLVKSPYRSELEAFLAAVETKGAPPVTGQDALRALRLSLAAKESANSGKPVEV
ncbi:MAG: Gfo/Idh/MocA family oxidoreductase [Firmicutes bacterium]|nr:Gfo/Idh/MocA family oxidoreductase [Bacillota bacterium]